MPLPTELLNVEKPFENPVFTPLTNAFVTLPVNELAMPLFIACGNSDMSACETAEPSDDERALVNEAAAAPLNELPNVDTVALCNELDKPVLNAFCKPCSRGCCRLPASACGTACAMPLDIAGPSSEVTAESIEEPIAPEIEDCIDWYTLLVIELDMLLPREEDSELDKDCCRLELIEDAIDEDRLDSNDEESVVPTALSRLELRLCCSSA